MDDDLQSGRYSVLGPFGWVEYAAISAISARLLGHVADFVSLPMIE